MKNALLNRIKYGVTALACASMIGWLLMGGDGAVRNALAIVMVVSLLGTCILNRIR